MKCHSISQDFVQNKAAVILAEPRNNHRIVPTWFGVRNVRIYLY